MYTQPSETSDDEIDQLRRAGFSDREIADVVAIVTINVLTGTFNLVSGLSKQITR